MNNAKQIGEIVRRARGDYSLREFSQKCNLSHTHLDSIEKGYDPRTGKAVSLTLETIQKLSMGTGYSVNELLGESVGFQNRLKDLREKNNMSQEELGKKIGYSRTAISAYETGRNQPSYNDLIKLSLLFDVSVDYLIGKSKERNETLTINEESDIHISAIQRGLKKSSPEDRKRALNMLKAAFEEAFSEDE